MFRLLPTLRLFRACFDQIILSISRLVQRVFAVTTIPLQVFPLACYWFMAVCGSRSALPRCIYLTIPFFSWADSLSSFRVHLAHKARESLFPPSGLSVRYVNVSDHSLKSDTRYGFMSSSFSEWIIFSGLSFPLFIIGRIFPPQMYLGYRRVYVVLVLPSVILWHGIK